MHTKSWLLGGPNSAAEVFLTGSVNTTHGGLEWNKEHLIHIREPAAILKALQDFENTWQEATVVVEKDIETMMTTARKREERKRQGHRSRSETVSRSLSVELDGASSV